MVGVTGVESSRLEAGADAFIQTGFDSKWDWLDAHKCRVQHDPMIYEAAQLIEQVAEASAVLFSMVLLFGALGILFYVRRFDYPASTVDIRDGQRGICNGCDKERHDLKEGHCRPCRDDIEARAW